MKLKDLLREITPTRLTGPADQDITGICYDSRKVTPGSLFVAISGFAADGNRFIPMAMQKGAAVVVTAKKPEQDIPYVLVENDRLALAMLGINFYGHPVEDMTLIGVTGTNGKTSSTLLLKQVLEENNAFSGEQKKLWMQKQMSFYIACMANDARFKSYSVFKENYKYIKNDEFFDEIIRACAVSGFMKKSIKCFMKLNLTLPIYILLKLYYTIK